MDIEEKISLVQRPPTEEVVTVNELRTLFETKSSPKHYIGLEISGKLHLGSLILTGFKINDFIKAGIQTNVFLADWHTYINNKLNNDWILISEISRYYEKAFKFFCPGVNIIFGSTLYDEKDDYWKNFVLFSKQITLSRIFRSLTIMGRTEKDTLDFSQLLYPSMQSVDIKALDLDIVHAGTDQRKIHMLVREVFPNLNWKTPVSVHHHLLPGLSEPATSTTSISDTSNNEKKIDDSKILSKMSKSNPSGSILIHDTEKEIIHKINKAYCPLGVSTENPILEIVKHIIFHQYDELIVERPPKYGGNISYYSYDELQKDYEQNKIHPKDLKLTTSRYLNEIVSPVRSYLYNEIPDSL
ncbi:MAG: tyrosine--tRNA ligase [Nitrosopumilus sp.]|nr:tyrosine--tRNA ligase [Nitrosopumilus sp.]